MARTREPFNWSCFFGADEFLKGNGGSATSKQEVADCFRARFEKDVATPPDQGGGMGDEPKEMPFDASSDMLRGLKDRDPDAFWQRIEDIRAGRIDRNSIAG